MKRGNKMRIYKEVELRNFEFWAGAADRAKLLTEADLETIERNLVELYPDGMDEMNINNIFWFDENFIAEILGFQSFDEIRTLRIREGDPLEYFTGRDGEVIF